MNDMNKFEIATREPQNKSKFQKAKIIERQSSGSTQKYYNSSNTLGGPVMINPSGLNTIQSPSSYV